MEEDPPPPDDPAMATTAARHKRQRSESGKEESGSSSIESTRTLQSDDLTFVTENGRLYANDSYYMPCDQEEQDRLTILHQVFVHALKGKLTTTSIDQHVKRILDLGTGPGDWAVAMANQYPHAEVVGLDLAVWDVETAEGEGGAGKVQWEIDDLDIWAHEPDVDEIAELLATFDPFQDPTARTLHQSPSRNALREQQERDRERSLQSPSSSASYNPYVLEPDIGWHFSQPFSLIHLRGLRGAFAYWEDVYTEIYKNLEPGGMVEIVDYEMVLPEIPGSTSTPGSVESQPNKSRPAEEFPFANLRKLYHSFMVASFKTTRPQGTFYMHPSYLEEAGFKDVRTTYVNVPVGMWPADEEQKKIGKMFLVVLMESMEPLCLRLLTKIGDSERRWSIEEVRHAIAEGKKEIMQWEERIVKQDIKEQEGWCASFKWVSGRKRE